jgi:hypothetical protein
LNEICGTCRTQESIADPTGNEHCTAQSSGGAGAVKMNNERALSLKEILYKGNNAVNISVLQLLI